MNDTQIATAADMILEDYPHLQTDDLKLCFDNAIKGKYGEVYNRIDVQVLFSWLVRYHNDRCTIAAAQSYNEAQRYKSDQVQPTEGMYYPEIISQLKNRASEGDETAKKSLELNNWVKSELEKRKLDMQRKANEEFREKEAERKRNQLSGQEI